MQISERNRFTVKTYSAILFFVALSVLQVKSQIQKNDVLSQIGSISRGSIKPDSILSQRSMTIVDVLRGQLAGVKANTSDGAPGAAIDFIIRGINSIRGDNQPLFILDGVMLNPTNLDVMNSWKALDGLDFQSNQNILSAINTENIDNIEVLKDASAIARYGSKGANGVVIIKSKVGNKNTMSVKWSSSVGVSTLPKRIDLLSPDNYLSYRVKLGNPLDASALQTADWQNEAFRNAISNNHNLSLSGTVRNTSYYLNVFLKNDEGIVKGTNAQSWGFQANLDQNLNDKVKFGTRIVLTNNAVSMTQSNSYLGATGLINQLAAAPFKGFSENAISWVNGYSDNATSWRMIPQVDLKVQFSPSFSFLLKAGADYDSKMRLRWMGTEIDRGRVSNARAGLSNFSVLQYNTDATLTYNRFFNQEHQIKLSFFGGYFGNSNVSTSIQGTDFFTDVLRAKGINLASKMVGPIYSKNMSSSVFAAVEAFYSFKNRYDLKVGERADYLLTYDNVPTYYPFIQGKWNISNESFFTNLNLDKTFDKLLLKVGYGISGTNSVDLYADADKYTLGQSSLWIPFENSLSYRTRLQTQKKELNLGFEASLLNNKLIVGVDIYKGTVTDVFSAYNFSPDKKVINADSTITFIPPLKHFLQNQLILDKQGIEIFASIVMFKKKDFQWNLNANLSIDRSKVVDSGSGSYLGATGCNGFKGATIGVLGGNLTAATAFINGKAPGVFYGYLTQGILSPDHETLTPPLKGQRLYAGDIKYIDMNGNGQTDEGDKVIIGNPNPDFTFGINSDIYYKRWFAQVRLDGSVGNQVLNLNKLMTDNVDGLNNISNSSYINAWVEGDLANKSSKIGSKVLNEISDRLVENGSFLRLSTFTIGYNIPLKDSKIIKWLNLNLVATNLLTISPYSGYNPDVNSFSGNWSIRGIDSGAYPLARSVSIGFVAKF